jgi:hypothetical protein
MLDALGSYPVVVGMFAIWGLSLSALLVGWHTAAAAWLSWLLTLWFYFRNPTFTNGGDEVVRLLTLYLALGYSAISPGRRALTFDGARARAVESQTTMQVHEAWPLRMIQVQICLVYLASGFLKVVGPAWWDGSALPLALGNHTFSRLGAPDWTWAQPFFAIGGIAIAWWELLFAALMVNKRTRVPALWFGVAMHAGIFVTMSIGIFSVIMIGGYAAFLTPAESRWIVERARGLLRRKREALPSA